MKNLIIIATLAIGLFGAIEAQAQYVEKIGGKIYIDVHDMYIGCWTTNSLNIDHLDNSSLNTMFRRFEIAGSDEATNLTWDASKSRCAARGAGWRLPTARELTLILMLNEVLLAATATPFVTGWYWSNTQSSANSNLAWAAYMPNEGVVAIDKISSTANVRCVREVTN